MVKGDVFQERSSEVWLIQTLFEAWGKMNQVYRKHQNVYYIIMHLKFNHTYLTFAAFSFAITVVPVSPQRPDPNRTVR